MLKFIQTQNNQQTATNTNNDNDQAGFKIPGSEPPELALLSRRNKLVVRTDFEALFCQITNTNTATVDVTNTNNGANCVCNCNNNVCNCNCG